MWSLFNNFSMFSSAVLRALLTIEHGQADAVIFAFRDAVSGGVDHVTVGGVWMDGAFSWRVAPGKHDKITAGQGTELYRGDGDEGDVHNAAVQLYRMMDERTKSGGEWALLD